MKKKKVGMLSFHNSLNYGATLQCFALQCTIKKMGYDAEFIDYDYWKNKSEISKLSLKSVIRWMALKIYKFLGNLFIVNRISSAFDIFKDKYLKISSKKYLSLSSINDLKENYDVYVTGSDQIWNPNREDLDVFGLVFVPNNINTISYAGSMGFGKIPEEYKEKLYKCLHGIRHVSCRESEGSNSLEKLLNKKVETVLDPTFLLTKDEWKNYLATANLPKKYVLCFFLGSLDYPRKVALRIAKENNCKLLIIPNSIKDVFTKGKKIYGCGPQEFLQLFYNATFVCTDSFHGTSFAVNFNKPFYTFCKRDYKEKISTITRINDILNLLNLSDRLVSSDENIDCSLDSCNFDEANKVLESERRKSLKFLKESLEDKN